MRKQTIDYGWWSFLDIFSYLLNCYLQVHALWCSEIRHPCIYPLRRWDAADQLTQNHHPGSDYSTLKRFHIVPPEKWCLILEKPFENGLEMIAAQMNFAAKMGLSKMRIDVELNYWSNKQWRLIVLGSQFVSGSGGAPSPWRLSRYAFFGFLSPLLIIVPII